MLKLAVLQTHTDVVNLDPQVYAHGTSVLLQMTMYGLLQVVMAAVMTANVVEEPAESVGILVMLISSKRPVGIDSAIGLQIKFVVLLQALELHLTASQDSQLLMTIS